MSKTKYIAFLFCVAILLAGCTRTPQPAITPGEGVVAIVNGEQLTKVDYENYKKGLIAYFLSMVKETERSGWIELDETVQYDEPLECFYNKEDILFKNEKKLFHHFLRDMAVATKARNYGNPDQILIHGAVKATRDWYIGNQVKEEILERASATEEELIKNCLSDYITILCYMGDVQTDYISNVYLPETGDKMPTIDWDKNPKEEEIQEYHRKFDDWMVNMAKGFAAYGEQLLESSEIVVYEQIGE